MIKLLLDANLSPETREYLVEMFHFDVIDLITENKGMMSDEDVVAMAKEESRIIITFDLDFGEIYHFREDDGLGVIVLRLEDQTVESVNAVLSGFFTTYANKIHLQNALVVLEEEKVRYYQKE